MKGRFFIARHGETVFNAAARMQGDAPHTPLTRAGFAQAEEMGWALRDLLGLRPAIALWASSSGRALQTMAILAELLERDWDEVRSDARLAEMDMGAWGGRLYSEIAAGTGSFVDRALGLFTLRPPGGEWYDGIRTRLQAWLDEAAGEEGDRLVVMHGISSRVLRGMLAGLEDRPGCGAPVAPALPQGSIVCIDNGRETVVHRGRGGEGVSRPFTA